MGSRSLLEGVAVEDRWWLPNSGYPASHEEEQRTDSIAKERDKGAKTIHWRKDHLFQTSSGVIGSLYAKNKTPYLSPSTKIN